MVKTPHIFFAIVLACRAKPSFPRHKFFFYSESKQPGPNTFDASRRWCNVWQRSYCVVLFFQMPGPYAFCVVGSTRNTSCVINASRAFFLVSEQPRAPCSIELSKWKCAMWHYNDSTARCGCLDGCHASLWVPHFCLFLLSSRSHISFIWCLFPAYYIWILIVSACSTLWCSPLSFWGFLWKYIFCGP